MRHLRGLLKPLPMLAIGLVLGTAARLFDIYFQNLGNIFSQIAIWILIGTLISVYSPTKKRAAMNVLPDAQRLNRVPPELPLRLAHVLRSVWACF